MASYLPATFLRPLKYPMHVTSISVSITKHYISHIKFIGQFTLAVYAHLPPISVFSSLHLISSYIGIFQFTRISSYIDRYKSSIPSFAHQVYTNRESALAEKPHVSKILGEGGMGMEKRSLYEGDKIQIGQYRGNGVVAGVCADDGVTVDVHVSTGVRADVGWW